MINTKKGTAHSLLQSDTYWPIDSSVDVTVQAGMICSVNPTSNDTIILGGAVGNLFGFAIGNSTDGDVIASGSLGLYLLDGNSVIETDQVYGTINYTNFPIGTPMYPQTGNTGLITSADSVAQIVGYVESIRQLPYTTVINGVPTYALIDVLAIKLS